MPPILLPYQLKEQISQMKEVYFNPSLEALTGNILEIGCGKGANFKFYSKDCSVFAIDRKIDLEHFEVNYKNAQCQLNIEEAEAERLPFKDEFFDAVIGSFVLCSVSSLELTLDEINRVLKKGGKLIFIEHVKSNNSFTASFQKILTVIHSLFSNDCHMDRDPRHAISKNKFDIITEKLFTNSLEPYLYLEAIKL